MEFIKPLPLKRGDKIAIISPSAGLPHVFPWVYEQELKRIKEVFQLTLIEFPTGGRYQCDLCRSIYQRLSNDQLLQV